MPVLSPIEQVRRHTLALKMQSLHRAATAPPPLDAPPLQFNLATAPYVAYPAPGAAAVVLLSYQVPPGMNALISLMSIFNVGNAFVDGSGNVIWRVLVNQASVKGLNNLQSQFGSSALPIPVNIPLVENDTIQVTVEIPNGQPAIGAGNTTGARFQGAAGTSSISTLSGLGQQPISQFQSGGGGGVNPGSPNIVPSYAGGGGGGHFAGNQS